MSLAIDFVLKAIFPGPEDAALDVLKALAGGAITACGATAITLGN